MTREEQIKKAASSNALLLEQNGFKAGARWADENPKSPWISVKERMPFLQSLVLVVLNDGSVSTARMCIVGGDKCWDADKNPDRYLELNEVLYWMPIPELPKGGEE